MTFAPGGAPADTASGSCPSIRRVLQHLVPQATHPKPSLRPQSGRGSGFTFYCPPEATWGPCPSGTALAGQEERKALTPEQVRDIRGGLGLSQKELAAKLGVSANSVGNWETGATTPRRKSVEKLLAIRG